jgi:SET domain-containing protein
MNTFQSSPKIYVSSSKIPKAGRGVFAKVNILKGELIESCPVLEIPPHDALHVNESILNTYIYYLGEKNDRLMIALGYGSLYNHTDKPNAMYKDTLKNARIDFIANQDISKDEEITVNYSQGVSKDAGPLWLSVE